MSKQKLTYLSSIITGIIVFFIYTFIFGNTDEKPVIKSNGYLCELKKLTLNSTKNQFFSNGTLFYKANEGKGDFEINVSCVAQELNSTGGIVKLKFPEILGVTPKQKATTQVEKSYDFKYHYKWKGDFDKTYDIFTTHNNFLIDNSDQNVSITIPEQGYKLEIRDKKKLLQSTDNNTRLVFVPDNKAPALNGMQINQDTLVNNNIFSYSTNQQADYSSLYEYFHYSGGKKLKIKYITAETSVNIKLPKIEDIGSGIQGFELSIETSDNPNEFSTFNYPGTTRDKKISIIESELINHNFKDVSNNSDFNEKFGNRNYKWAIRGIGKDNELFEDKICDMVGNCAYIPTPDINVIAGKPKDKKVSSIYDLKDKYNNKITPVFGAKDYYLKFLIKDIGNLELLEKDKQKILGYIYFGESLEKNLLYTQEIEGKYYLVVPITDTFNFQGGIPGIESLFLERYKILDTQEVLLDIKFSEKKGYGGGLQAENIVIKQ